MKNRRSRYLRWGQVSLLAACVTATLAHAQQRPVRFVQETPWSVSALGISEEALPILVYWAPGAGRYYLALTPYLTLLGVPVVSDSLLLETPRFTFDGTTGAVVRADAAFRLDSTDYFVGPDDLYVSFAGLRQLFAPASLQVDYARLHLTHAVAAPGQVSPLPSRPGPLRYGRSRTLWGHTRLDYRLTRTQWQAYAPTYHGFLRAHTNALGGRILAEGLASHTDRTRAGPLRTLSYLLDFPEATWLTQIEGGRLHAYGWPRPTAYDGLHLNNRPVADRYRQREARLQGVAEPGAVVTASVGGVVVERVYADEQGRYTVRIPAYYGASKAQVDIEPADGGPVTTRVHTLYVSQELPPPGTLYWEARLGRETGGDHPLTGFAEVRYGLTPHLAVRAAYGHAPVVGLTQSWRGLAADLQHALPTEATRLRLWAQSRAVRLQAEATHSQNSAWNHYRRHYSGTLGWQRAHTTLFLQASRHTTFDDRTYTSLNTSATTRLGQTTSMLLMAGIVRTPRQKEETAKPWQRQWSSTLTQTLTRSTRIGLHAEGGRDNDLDFVGITLHAQWRWSTLGLRIGYDEGLATSITLRVDAPWGSITNRTTLGPDTPTHSQSLYGSMELGAQPRLTQQAQARSSALLRVFLDADRDGRKDPHEPYIPKVDIQVDRAQLQKVNPETVRADLLVPHQYYQVTVDPRSLNHPRLVLMTGEQFSFVADPGQTKHILIPVQKNTIVEGDFRTLPPFAATRLRVTFHQDETEVAHAEVSQTGRFCIRLAPGTYQVTLQDLLERLDLRHYQHPLHVLDQPTQRLQLTYPNPDPIL